MASKMSDYDIRVEDHWFQVRIETPAGPVLTRPYIVAIESDDAWIQLGPIVYSGETLYEEYERPWVERGFTLYPSPNPGRRCIRVKMSETVVTQPPTRYWAQVAADRARGFCDGELHRIGRMQPCGGHPRFCGFRRTDDGFEAVMFGEARRTADTADAFVDAVYALVMGAAHPAGVLDVWGIHPGQAYIDGTMGRPEGVHT